MKKLRPWEKKVLQVLAIIGSFYLGLVFIGVIPVHCDAYKPKPPHQAQLLASSSKAIEQTFCNTVLILTGTTGKFLVLIIPFGLLGRGVVTIVKKVRRRARAPN
jgi:hypothetical protein